MKRYCKGNERLGGDPCNTDISRLHGNTKYCASCQVKIKALNNSKEAHKAKARARIDEAFKVYHEKHEELYDMIVMNARVLRGWMYNFETYSMRRLFYDLRGMGHHVPNNFSRPYRELIEKNEPDLVGFFTGGEK